MAQYQNVIGGQRDWIHELAKAEIHPDAEKILHLGKSFDPHQLVEESIIEFLLKLREHFSDYLKVFNGYAQSGTRFQEVKIYGISQSAADFMLFRNQVKLIVASNTHGVIQLSFMKHIQGSLGMGNMGSAEQSSWGHPQELIAEVGPFRDVFWTYQRQKVTPDQVAKFYFAEFIRATRDGQRTRQNNQLLLDQVKALLQEKGLDL